MRDVREKPGVKSMLPRVTRRNLALISVLILAASSLTGCLTQTGAQAPDTIKVGAVVPLTGRYGSLGEQVRNGYEFAVDAINRDGGVNVRQFGKKIPLELRLLDDESDPTKTVQRQESLAAENIVAYLGGAGSDLHAAAAPIAEKNKTPYLGIAFALYSIHQQRLKYLFSPFPKSPALAKMTFDMMDSLNPKPTRVAIFAERTDWGAELKDLWKKEAQPRGYQIVADEEYAPGSQDFSSQILNARNNGAQALLSLPTPPDGMAIMRQLKELDANIGFHFMIRAPDGSVWAQNLQRDGDYVIQAPGWSTDLKFQGVAEVLQAHQAKYNKPADALVGVAYSCIQILANAIERAGRLDKDAIRDNIASTDMTTVDGPVKFNPDGTGQVIGVANQWQNGRQVLVWPREQAVGQIQYPAPNWSAR